LRWRRFGPGRQKLADPRRGGHRQRGQTFQPVQDILLVRVGPVTALAVGLLGLQEFQRVVQECLANLGVRGAVVGVEPLG